MYLLLAATSLLLLAEPLQEDHPGQGDLEEEGLQGAVGGEAVQGGRELEAGQHYQSYAVQEGGVRKSTYKDRGREPARPLGTPLHTCQ